MEQQSDTNTTSQLTSNISGARPDRSASHDSVNKRRASRHPVANKRM